MIVVAALAGQIAQLPSTAQVVVDRVNRVRVPARISSRARRETAGDASNHVSLVDVAGQGVPAPGPTATAALTRAVTRMALKLGSMGPSDLYRRPGARKCWKYVTSLMPGTSVCHEKPPLSPCHVSDCPHQKYQRRSSCSETNKKHRCCLPDPKTRPVSDRLRRSVPLKPKGGPP